MKNILKPVGKEERVFEEIYEHSDTQKFKVLEYEFYDKLTENVDEAGYLKLENTVNGEHLTFSIWLSDLEEKSFYICIPVEEDEDDYDVINVEDLNIFYEERIKSEYPSVDVIQMNGYSEYQIKEPSHYSLSIGEGYTYMPIRYFIMAEADPSFDEVGAMTFLHVETGKEVESSLYTTDFESETLYVCLPCGDCSEEDGVTFLIDFNELRIPLHQHIKEQQATESA